MFDELEELIREVEQEAAMVAEEVPVSKNTQSTLKLYGHF